MVSPESYHLSKNERLNEAINRAWNRCDGAWRSFQGTAREGCQELGTPNSKLGTGSVTMEVAGFCEVIDWVMGFGRQAEVLEPEHLRKAVAEELVATAGIYGEKREPVYEEDSQRRTS